MTIDRYYELSRQKKAIEEEMAGLKEELWDSGDVGEVLECSNGIRYRLCEDSRKGLSVAGKEKLKAYEAELLKEYFESKPVRVIREIAANEEFVLK
jgi:hypothetical protein